MDHKLTIDSRPSSLAELAASLGDLRYDALADFLQCLADKLESDGHADAHRSRPQLAASLLDSAGKLSDAAIAIEKAWTISRPHM